MFIISIWSCFPNFYKVINHEPQSSMNRAYEGTSLPFNQITTQSISLGSNVLTPATRARVRIVKRYFYPMLFNSNAVIFAFSSEESDITFTLRNRDCEMIDTHFQSLYAKSQTFNTFRLLPSALLPQPNRPPLWCIIFGFWTSRHLLLLLLSSSLVTPFFPFTFIEVALRACHIVCTHVRCCCWVL